MMGAGAEGLTFDCEDGFTVLYWFVLYKLVEKIVAKISANSALSSSLCGLEVLKYCADWSIADIIAVR